MMNRPWGLRTSLPALMSVWASPPIPVPGKSRADYTWDRSAGIEDEELVSFSTTASFWPFFLWKAQAILTASALSHSPHHGSSWLHRPGNRFMFSSFTLVRRRGLLLLTAPNRFFRKCTNTWRQVAIDKILLFSTFTQYIGFSGYALTPYRVPAVP